MLQETLLKYSFRYHINHPFDKLLQSGKATKEMLQMWAANRYYYQDTIPRKDACIISNCPHSDIRAIWSKHVITHDVDGGLSEWLQLTKALGLTDAEVKSLKYLLPITKFACDAYYNFCNKASWQDGMCSSMTHLFAGNIHQLRIATWPERYPWLPKEAFTYFTKRTQTLPCEIDDTLKILSEYYCESSERMESAINILKFKQDILWSMLDGLWHYFFAKECRMPQEIVSKSTDPCLRILGSAAGGGVPQWNRNDHWNDSVRHGCGTARTQSSFAVSIDRENWVLINCSPDIGHQWNDLVKQYPNAKMAGIVLTDAQLDHIGGLLSLREGAGLDIYCTTNMQHVLKNDTKFLDILSTYTCVRTVTEFTEIAGVNFKSHVIAKRRAKYASTESDVLALEISISQKKMLVIPCVPELTVNILELVNNHIKHSHPVLFDGTFETDDEMPHISGHVSMEATKQKIPEGLIFCHLNNTNKCMTIKGHMIAYDGLELT